MPRVIAIVVGETAGHVYPALAVADAYRAAFDDVEVVFLGTPASAGARIVTSRGEGIRLIQAAPIARRSWPGRVGGATRSLVGAVQARGILHRQGVRIALGFGGFASTAVLFAARSLGVVTALHEANVVPGLGEPAGGAARRQGVSRLVVGRRALSSRSPPRDRNPTPRHHHGVAR
jgi:UDP-N-acetylglucosamine--N-acetylmuramyl-(pentapeptide) pyrophosphoryl-undecaprenol N-acetylglucosamine transferase